MRALITNDDGVASEGIRTLAACAHLAGLDVTVAAPSWDTSGASASLTAVEKDGRVLVARQPAHGWGDVQAFGVEAAPAYIVRAGVHGAFGPPPDIVLSGVNSGPNTGHAVLHSGTVGAAMTASTFGRPAAAFSLDNDGSRPANWETAATVIQSVLSWLIDNPRQIVLNVNIPDVPPDRLQGLVEARLSNFGAVQTNVTEIGEGYVKLEYREMAAEADPGTDVALLDEGYACFTPLTVVCENAGADVAGLRDEPRVTVHR
jgi:5'-nucleotidase